MTPERSQLLTDIAQKHLGISTIKIRGSDRLDHREVRVDALENALNAAFEAGLAQEREHNQEQER